ncbi:2TM domain-containing protein [Delftia sp. PS-11]|uniref:2TM domain-containing protein n=1 Tax=Delftia sp. PS-11 TaxID=2767222 RepID=UPI0024555A49|nr:2TM domain-containing protein [Delftia sp. PS-11]KAJ8745218.1 2TM domain-containing protein [Delftia sp. PS-11]
MHAHHGPAGQDTLERQARRRASAKMGWFLHASIYVLVNLGLAALSLYQGRHWALFPALGWGLGLAIHGAIVWLGNGWHARLLERERQALEQRQNKSQGR